MIPTDSALLLYQTDDGQTKIEVRLQDETVWLSQAQLSELFDKDRRTVGEHIQNIFTEKELEENSVCRKFRHTASDGKNYQVVHYNLDVIISVGYRVSSHRGTQFRIWATNRLKEFLIKGFTTDAEIAKNYLSEEELRVLNLIVSLYLDFAELQALSRIPMSMKDWIVKLDDFLRMASRDILSHSGKISHEEALDKARMEYSKHQKQALEAPSLVEQHFLETIKEFEKVALSSS